MTFIFYYRKIVAALKNMNSALKLNCLNLHIYFHTLDDIKLDILQSAFLPLTCSTPRRYSRCLRFSRYCMKPRNVYPVSGTS